MPPKSKVEDTTTGTDPDVIEAETANDIAVGSLVKLTDQDRYAILIGYTDEGHPLLMDLPGVAREHQTGIEKV